MPSLGDIMRPCFQNKRYNGQEREEIESGGEEEKRVGGKVKWTIIWGKIFICFYHENRTAPRFLLSKIMFVYIW